MLLRRTASARSILAQKSSVPHFKKQKWDRTFLGSSTSAQSASIFGQTGFREGQIDVSTSLARLTGLDGFARAILVGVVPLMALKTFGSKDIISSVYFASALFTLLFTMNIALLERVLRRRRLMILGGLCLIAGVGFFYTEFAPFFAIGVGMRAAGASIFSVCMSLYIMDYIPKANLRRNESRRMLHTGAAWLIGPTLGVWIFENSNNLFVYAIAITSALAMIFYFRRLRLEPAAVALSTKRSSKNPLKSASRFIRQPRLRIAYWLTLTRSCFWAMLFVYGPIYVVESGLPVWISGILLSGVSGLLLFSPIVERFADRFGTRQVLIACSIIIGTSLIALGLLGDPQPIGLLFWISGAIGGVGMDVLANIPFIRMVRPSERTEMTTIFTTWREGSALLTQGLVFLTLLVAPFWVFYCLLGLMQFSSAICTSFLPRRL